MYRHSYYNVQSITLTTRRTSLWLVMLQRTAAVAIISSMTLMLHTNFKAYKPILVIFGRYVAESTLSNGMQHDWKDTISRVNVSPGSAETLARTGGITNHCLIAYSLSNISAKKYLQLVVLSWSYSVLHQCRLFETQCTYKSFKLTTWHQLTIVTV